MRFRIVLSAAGAAALLAVSSTGAFAQGIKISPLIGVYTQANSIDQLRASADTLSIKRESALALGANLEMGFLRATVNYVSGATIKQAGGTNVSTTGDIGKGKILMGALDAVLRPIPRIIVVQPYAVAGIGFKQFNYDSNQNATTTFSNLKKSSAAAHAGLGADAMFGPVGVVAEVTDYINQGDPDSTGKKQLQHDAYGMVGLRIRLF